MPTTPRPSTAHVRITPEQYEALEPLFMALNQFKGGTVVAQVWPDGMRVAVLDKAASDAVAQALGGYRSLEPAHSLAESIAKQPAIN